jgi:hypothetical protein
MLGACNSTARTAAGSGNEEEENNLTMLTEAIHMHVYPNPTSGMFTIELPQAGPTNVIVTDIAGRVIISMDISDNTQQQLQLDLANEAKGLYFIKVMNSGNVYQSKVTLQ